LLDEIDELLDADAREQPAGMLAKTFRALAHEQLCSFVFAGSKTLHHHLHDARSPFFNFCQEYALGPLSQKGVEEIVVKPMRQLGIVFEDQERVVGEVLRQTSCHPSLVQWLCDQLVASVQGHIIGLHNVERIVAGQAFRQHYLETAWGDSSTLEKFVSLLIDPPHTSMDVLRQVAAGYSVTYEALRSALDTLKIFSLVSLEADSVSFVLAQFPEIVRQEEDVPALIENWREQAVK